MYSMLGHEGGGEGTPKFSERASEGIGKRRLRLLWRWRGQAAAAGTTLPAPAPTHYVPSGVSMPAAHTNTTTTTHAPCRWGWVSVACARSATVVPTVVNRAWRPRRSVRVWVVVRRGCRLRTHTAHAAAGRRCRGRRRR